MVDDTRVYRRETHYDGHVSEYARLAQIVHPFGVRNDARQFAHLVTHVFF